MSWRFWRKPAPEAPKQTDDWKAGDLAQCIQGTPWFQQSGMFLVQIDGPARGSVSRVTDIRLGTNFSGEPDIGLEVAGFAGWWSSTAFTKITPSSDEFARSITRKVDA